MIHNDRSNIWIIYIYMLLAMTYSNKDNVVFCNQILSMYLKLL